MDTAHVTLATPRTNSRHVRKRWALASILLLGALSLVAILVAPAAYALNGWDIQYGAPNRPAILLVHGLGESTETWKNPPAMRADLIVGIMSYRYDHRHTPPDRRVGDTHSTPNVGIYKVGHSDLLDQTFLKNNSWWEFLKGQGFTVATWTQDGATLADAYPSAENALRTLVDKTKAMNPASPPPIALIGHSRGGVLIRKLLKQYGNMGGRIRWVVTLCSPHQGSELARAPGRLAAELVDLMDVQIPASLSAPLKKELKDLAVELARPLTKWIMLDAQRELLPGGPLLRDLASGESEVAGVKYYSFGGVTPTYVRLYTWLFDANSAVPQTKVETQGIYTKVKTYFVWRVKAAEVPFVSPLFDKVRDFVPEIKPGRGDGVVTDASARLPLPSAVHVTTHLNHFEVLWDRNLQNQVVGLLSVAFPRLPSPVLPLKKNP